MIMTIVDHQHLKFDQRVNEALTEGWHRLGDVHVFQTPGGSLLYIQTLAREDRPRETSGLPHPDVRARQSPQPYVAD